MTRTATRLIAFFLAAFLAAPAFADGAFDFQQAAALERARVLKGTGIALTVLGVASEVTTIVLWVTDVAQRHCGINNPCSGRPGEQAPPEVRNAAIATSALAPALLGAGIPLWAVGAHRERKLKAAVSVTATGAIHF